MLLFVFFVCSSMRGGGLTAIPPPCSFVSSYIISKLFVPPEPLRRGIICEAVPIPVVHPLSFFVVELALHTHRRYDCRVEFLFGCHALGGGPPRSSWSDSHNEAVRCNSYVILYKPIKDRLENRGGDNVPFGTQESVGFCSEDDKC